MSIEFQLEQLKLWMFIDKTCLKSKEPFLPAVIIDYAIENKIDSRKTMFSILQQFLDVKMIHKPELSPDNLGRLKKTYTRSKKGNDETLLVNLKNLPPNLRSYIDE